MELIPISHVHSKKLKAFRHPDCREVLEMFPKHYRISGFEPPWIGYLIILEGGVVGSCGFKSSPVDGKVEIAYWTFEQFQHRGIATQSCRELVKLSLCTDPEIIISARTSSLINESSRILRRNGFKQKAILADDGSGDVFEWIYEGKNLRSQVLRN